MKSGNKLYMEVLAQSNNISDNNTSGAGCGNSDTDYAYLEKLSVKNACGYVIKYSTGIESLVRSLPLELNFEIVYQNNNRF